VVQVNTALGTESREVCNALVSYLLTSGLSNDVLSGPFLAPGRMTIELYKDRITVKRSQEFELLPKEPLSSTVFKDGVLNQLHLESSSC